MITEKTLKIFLATLLLFAFCISLPYPAHCAQKRKIGILFGGAGTPTHYRGDWPVQFFNFMFDIFDPGFFAGGPLEGKSCYTLIHYANEAEAAICGVEEGTPIDVFCNQYTGSYTVHELPYHEPPPWGDDDFRLNCFYSDPFPPSVYYPLIFGNTTIDPATGSLLFGPHVDDPDGAGIGIADFLEMADFSMMDTYYRMPNHTMPYTEHLEKWWYGNAAPNYPPEDPEPINVKDRLQELLPQYDIAVRHGWDEYAENVDIFGIPKQYPDSYETAIDNLINKDKVDTIIVAYPEPMYSNLKQYGHEWYDNNDQGISNIQGKTYKECVEDINDGVGPATQEELDTFLTNKPWYKHEKHPFPLIKYLAESKKPTIDLRFIRSYGEFEEYGLAELDMLNYTVNKYNIHKDTSLKVILLNHGYSSMYMNAAACDCYLRMAEDMEKRVITRIKDNFSWSGKFDVVAAPYSYAEGNIYDPPSKETPFGKVMSTGEVVETSINGTYVNALGDVVDNGIDNFDTIIIMNVYFFAEDNDVLYETRELFLGNNIYSQGEGSYTRDEKDADGTVYNADDIDEDYFTVRVFDGTVWPSTPGCLQDPKTCKNNSTVYKGSAQKPTKVIVCGTILGNAHAAGRQNLNEVEVKSIIEAIQEPNIVDLKYLRAASLAAAVKLTWITTSETGNKGFNIYRASSADGEYGKVNDELIPSSGGNSKTARYKFVDIGLAKGTQYFYMVEAVKNPVRTKKYGPVSARPSVVSQ